MGPGEGDVYPASISCGRGRRGEFRYALYCSGPGDWLPWGRWGRDMSLQEDLGQRGYQTLREKKCSNSSSSSSSSNFPSPHSLCSSSCAR